MKKRLILLFIVFATFLKAEKIKSDYYFSINPNLVIDELAVPMLGTSFGVKGKGKFNGFDTGVELYFLGGVDVVAFGHAQYIFHPSTKGKLKPYLGTGISLPMFFFYKDDMSILNKGQNVIKWNKGLLFGLKSTIGFTYPVNKSKGFTEFSVTYPMFNPKELGFYNKDQLDVPNAVDMKIGFMF